ncbi:hypothetical protein GIB67_013031 [Kingdonia uniflora]|uniref:KIB1-4 beta-propeller domain-containing protein n=1 Tax=Kingdonia uniflora TaxID=39325 RepID=A0A7J7MCU0_9MAGN|nr:hypothetical protein GIB67_013031 [Kingdonia uniflora]
MNRETNVYRLSTHVYNDLKGFNGDDSVTFEHDIDPDDPIDPVALEIYNNRRRDHPEDFSDSDDSDEEDPGDMYNNNFLVKVVLSANPSWNSDYAIMAIYGSSRKLAFLSLVEAPMLWTTIEPDTFTFNDVSYFNKEFYAVTRNGDVVACDVEDSCPKVRNVIPELDDGIGKKKHLVESLGELLLVRRLCFYTANLEQSGNEYDDDAQYDTMGFNVFKLDPTGCNQPVEMKTLHGQSLFLGSNSSISISSSNFPECKPNCIYFTEDHFDCFEYSGGPQDLGVFNLEKGILEPNFLVEFKGLMPPPI